jgi:predicted AAA+ superfamily ATPase
MNAPLPLIFDNCKPKDDVRSGTIADAEFAADLSMVLRGNAPPGYLDAKLFFGNAYPTRGLKNLLLYVRSRLSRGTGVASIFRLDISYGGGKTGREGYERVKPSDVGRMAPGADTLRELFDGKPTLILLDELSVYLHKVANLAGAKEQLTAFLTSLFKAIESSPNGVLVYTLAVGKDGKLADAMLPHCQPERGWEAKTSLR